MTFLLFALLLILVALIFIVPGLLGARRSVLPDHQQATIEATRQQLEAINKDAEDNLVEPDQLKTIREETEALLLLELKDQADKDTEKDRSATFYGLSTVVIVLMVPLLALLIYTAVGNPTSIFQAQQNNVDQQVAADQKLPSVDEMIEQLEARLEQEPDDLEGWYVLARTYMVTQQFADAETAMQKVYELSGDDPDVLVRYADAVVMASGGTFNDKANRLIEEALQVDGNHSQALWLAGMSSFRALDYQTAINYFQKSKATVSDPENKAELEKLISIARERAGIAEQDTVATTEEQAQPSDNKGISVTVDIAEKLKQQISTDDHLFVFAKAAAGPPMPLAVSKHKAGELPLAVTLTDAMAMIPSLKLSGFDQIVVSARISKSGEPTAQSGDFQGQSVVIDPNQTNRLRVVIDEIVN